ncbi:MAG TPA: superoxide dismutase family protein [Sphingomicrobium sp.]|nr:superoxide dismutase family protein [Sphingomicrobium sp.]
MRGMFAALALAPLAAAALGGCATAQDPRYARQFALVGTSGQSLGTVSAWETAGAVSMRVQARGLPHGLHGIHVHAVGRCQPPEFTTAGSHWNPSARKHGLNNPEGPHAGDLPNISVAATGVVNEAVVLSGASLAALADADGSALVIHATADDHVTDPSGNSGARVACAIISPATR